ncbi:unnamed protein product [Paramecium sonneborni]|uniref:Uncharacterized protein n=1 Tax=Paramecium sonneborni TaxID=65129 RepID=A0A8S1RTX0_9CILI|nr:unnamed protein product [Paramecium sonneborni]
MEILSFRQLGQVDMLMGCQDRVIKSKIRRPYLRCILSLFSPDGNTLASGSLDKSIRIWDVKKGQQKINQMIMIIMQDQSVSLLMEIISHLVVMITLYVFGM